MAIYEALPAPASTEQADPPLPNPRTAFLKVKFHKVVSKTFEIQRVEETEKTVLAEHKRISRTFVPFVTSPNMECTLAGVFFTGDRPCWIIATDKGGLRVVPSGHTVVYAFTACSLWESKGDFLLYSDEVCVLYAEKSSHSLAHALRVPLSLNGHQESNLTVVYRTAAFLDLARTRTLYLNHRPR
jgi:cleavage and polyadenylation specificity factor subunit 1